MSGNTNFGLAPSSTYPSQGSFTSSVSFNATTGQTLFTLTQGSYVPGTGSLVVYMNGLKLRNVIDYTESSTTSFTLTSGAPVGAELDCIVGYTTNTGWAPGQGAAAVVETHTATASQTSLITTNTYAPGMNTLDVFVNGLKLSLGVDYTETSANQITFVTPLTLGAKVTLKIWRTGVVSVGDSSVVTYTPAGTGAVATTVQSKLRESVSVRDFGAVGDGTTDDTVAIQNALNSGHGYITGRAEDTYNIVDTLVIPSNVIFDLKGGAICPSTTVPNTTSLYINGNYVKMSGATNSQLINAVLKAPIAIVGLSGYPVATVSIENNSANCKVTNCTNYCVNFTNGFVINASDYCEISECYSNAGITYSYAGGNFNKVFNNILINCVNALTGTGNGAGSRLIAKGNKVSDNVIINPSRMGIEDYSSGFPATSYITGTEISNNKITSGSTTAAYSAISAVSPNTTVKGNLIVNWNAATEAIELTGGRASIVTDNQIIWDESSALVRTTDAILNNLTGLTLSSTIGQNIISNNLIKGAKRGVWVFQYLGVGVNVVGNSFYNCASVVDAFFGEPVTCCNNQITMAYNRGAVSGGFFDIGANANYSGNFIRLATGYVQPSTGGPDTIFHAIGNNTIIDDNTIDASLITTGATVQGIATNGATPSNISFKGNRFIGAIVNANYQYFVNLRAINNNVDGGIAHGTNKVVGFSDSIAPIPVPAVTGAKGGNVALGSVITQLVNLGLITDSTTA